MGKRRGSRARHVEVPCDTWVNCRAKGSRTADLAAMLNLKKPKPRNPILDMDFMLPPTEIKATKQTKLNAFFKKEPDRKQVISPEEYQSDSSDDFDLPKGIDIGPEMVAHDKQGDLEIAMPYLNDKPSDGVVGRTISKPSSCTGFTFIIPDIPSHIDQEDDFTRQYSDVKATAKVTSRSGHQTSKRKRSKDSSSEDDFIRPNKDSCRRKERNPNSSLMELDPNIFGSPEYDATVLKSSTSTDKCEDEKNNITTDASSQPCSAQRRVLSLHEDHKDDSEKSEAKYSQFSASQDISSQNTTTFTQRVKDKRKSMQKVVSDFENELGRLDQDTTRKRRTPLSENSSPELGPMTFRLSPSQQPFNRCSDNLDDPDESVYTFHETRSRPSYSKHINIPTSKANVYQYQIKDNDFADDMENNSCSSIEDYTFHVTPRQDKAASTCWAPVPAIQRASYGEEGLFKVHPQHDTPPSGHLEDSDEFSQEDLSPLTFH